jgi:hypothetical protein
MTECSPLHSYLDDEPKLQPHHLPKSKDFSTPAQNHITQFTCV